MDDDCVEIPDFVEAEAVETIAGDLLLLTFPDKLRFYTLSNVFEAELLYNEIMVVQEYTQPPITLGEASCVVDAGANIGLFTYYIKSRFPDATVYAFEPMAETFAVLERNVALNALDGVHLFNFALGSGDCAERDFVYYPNMTANSTATPASKDHFQQVLSDWRDEEQARHLVTAAARVLPVRTLSSVLAAEQIGTVDLLKIDVEGDELEVLRGIAPEHQARIRQIAAEIHGDELVTQCQACLEGMGYSVTLEQGMTTTAWCSYLYAVRP